MLGTSEVMICKIDLQLQKRAMLAVSSCMWPVPGGGREEKGAAIFVPAVVCDGSL